MGKNWFSVDPKEHLDGKVAIVTGGGTGIGAACAETLAAAGAKIVVAARRKEKLESTVSSIREAGGEAIAVSADVTKQEDIDKIVSETISTYGRIDILVSNAGMALPRCHTFDFTREDWRRIFDLNLDAGYFLAQACGKEMAKTGGGRIVFMTSQRGISAMQNIAPYCITKGAVMAMVKALAIDLAPYQINVNGVAPGYVMTDMVSGLLADEARLKNVLDKTPLGKMGNTDEMAAAVLYFCLPQSSYTTGQTAILDGGWSCQ